MTRTSKFGQRQLRTLLVSVRGSPSFPLQLKSLLSERDLDFETQSNYTRSEGTSLLVYHGGSGAVDLKLHVRLKDDPVRRMLLS